jgi:hypothetical protein
VTLFDVVLRHGVACVTCCFACNTTKSGVDEKYFFGINFFASPPY